MILDLYSKRQKRLQGDVPDVYTYDEIPTPLRVQIVQIWKETLGSPSNEAYRVTMSSLIESSPYEQEQGMRAAYEFIVKALRREYGVFKLHNGNYDGNDQRELANFFLNEREINKVIDVVELIFRYIDLVTRDWNFRHLDDASKRADNAIAELNIRFKEHGIGYQYEDKIIIRVDSELIHVEAVKPALRLLNTTEYRGAQEEFLSAYNHYQKGRHKESLNDCLKSFESTMKAICDKHNWQYSPKASSKELIKVCFENKLIPIFWQTHLSSLRSMLESSIPTGRNKLSGHGQGTTPTTVPDHLVAYMLHMTASTLVFLTTAEKDLP